MSFTTHYWYPVAFMRMSSWTSGCICIGSVLYSYALNNFFTLVVWMGQRCVREYRLLLSEVVTPEAGAKQVDDGKSILTSWHEAKKVLKSDPRYSKMPRREREPLWRRHADDLQRRIKAGDTTGREDISSGRAASPTRGSTDHRMRSPARRSRR